MRLSRLSTITISCEIVAEVDGQACCPLIVIGGAPISTIPKSWAPSTGGRPPALGSNNPWTSVPRGLGLDRGGALRPLLRSAPFRATSVTAGAALVGAGVWNAGVAVGGLIGAAFSD